MYPKTIEEVRQLVNSGKISTEQAMLYTQFIEAENQRNMQFPTLSGPTEAQAFYPTLTGEQPDSMEMTWPTAMGPSDNIPFYPTPTGEAPNFENDFGPASTSGRPLSDFSSREEYIQYRNQLGFDPTTAGEDWDETRGMPGSSAGARTRFPYIYPGGSDLTTELFGLGRAIGMEKGTRGKTAAVVGNTGAALFDIGRNIASGIGYQRRNNYVNDWYRDQQYGSGNYNYTAAPQYQNTNYQGGFYGEEGGEVSQQDMAQQEQQSAQAMQQIATEVSTAIQQGQSPEAVLQVLIQRGVPQEQARQIVLVVVQQLQQQQMAVQQAQPSLEEQEQMQDLQPQEDFPEMKNGGKFKHKVGDYVEFMYGGIKKKGKIKKIENGQIYL